jgi:hypothetical protein
MWDTGKTKDYLYFINDNLYLFLVGPSSSLNPQLREDKSGDDNHQQTRGTMALQPQIVEVEWLLDQEATRAHGAGSNAIDVGAMREGSEATIKAAPLGEAAQIYIFTSKFVVSLRYI